MYKYESDKQLKDRNARRRHIHDDYIPDDLEKINEAIDGLYAEDMTIDEEKSFNELFSTLNKTIHNQKEIKRSSNYKIMTDYLSKLKKTINGRKTDPKMRLNIVRDLLKNDNHFTNLTERLFDCPSSDRYVLLAKFVEFPLECMSSYIQGTTNSNTFLRRKYFDGQIRKRKDGSTYQRQHNILTESDLVTQGENGEEISPYKMLKSYDKYFNNIEELLSALDDDEKEVALWLNCLSTSKKRATIKELVEHTKFTKRQVETIETKIKIKVLKWLHDNDMRDIYMDYYSKCQKYKDFEKKYKNYLKKCEKTKS